MNRSLPVGVDHLEKIIKEGKCCIDKNCEVLFGKG